MEIEIIKQECTGRGIIESNLYRFVWISKYIFGRTFIIRLFKKI